MKPIAILLFPTIVLAQFAAMAQKPTAKPHTASHAAATTSAALKAGCATLPTLSPKIPALPAGAPCAKLLYTLTTQPSIHIDYVSPLEGTALKDTLGLGPTSFSLNYIDTKIGSGELAQPKKWYTIKYTGYLVDGTKFDSSDDHPGQPPFSFAYGAHSVVAGWDTGFAGMHVGGKRRLFIPQELAYGPNAHGAIPGKSMLIFDLEFVSQSDTDPALKTPATPPAAAAPKPAAAPPASTGPAAAQPATPPAEPATPPADAAPKPQ